MSFNNPTIKKLKDLTNQPVTSEEVKRVFADLRQAGSDRAAVLISTSLLEKQFEKLFLAHMVTLKNEERDALFTRGGPLTSYSAKIKIAYALGWIPAEIRRELDTIREIRNAFAHTEKPLSFRTPEVRAACNLLTQFKDAPHFLGPKKRTHTPRAKFLSHVLYYAMIVLDYQLMVIAQNHGRKKQTVEDLFMAPRERFAKAHK